MFRTSNHTFLWWLQIFFFQNLEDTIFKEVTEYRNIFDEVDTEYEHCVAKNKSLEIAHKNILLQSECLIANNIAKDVFSIVLTSKVDLPVDVETSLPCDKENTNILELEAEI